MSLFKTESPVKISSGAVEAQSGPHHPKFHLDEIELISPIVWDKMAPFMFAPIKPIGLYNGRTARGRARRS